MAHQNQNAPANAWADFAATGSVQDYLRYRAAQNRADAVTGISNVAGGRYANPSPGAARHPKPRKRPPDNGPY